MNTSTSLQALAALAVGSALLASTTPADAARGGFRPAAARPAAAHVSRAPARVASFSRAPARVASFAHAPAIRPHVAPMRSNARSLLGDLGKVGSAVVGEVKKVGGDVVSGKISKIPGDVLKTGSKVAGAVVKTGANIFTLPPPKLPNPPKLAEKQGSTTSDASGFNPAKKTVPAAVLASQIAAQRPVFVPTQGPVFVPTTAAKTGTTTSTTTANGNSGQFIQQRIAAARQAAAAANLRPANFPVRPQLGGRGGFATSAPMMSPGPAYVAPASQPAPVAPVATQPSAPTPVQPSCLRQAVTQDGQVVTFDVCTNQAVVGPLAQTQTQPQTQTQTQTQ
jgi:hypothetical protein